MQEPGLASVGQGCYRVGMTEARQKRTHDHVGHMIFTAKYAFCKGCEMHWTLGQYGWIPDDDDRTYRGQKKFTPKGKKNWKRK